MESKQQTEVRSLFPSYLLDIQQRELLHFTSMYCIFPSYLFNVASVNVTKYNVSEEICQYPFDLVSEFCGDSMEMYYKEELKLDLDIYEILHPSDNSIWNNNDENTETNASFDFEKSLFDEINLYDEICLFDEIENVLYHHQFGGSMDA